MEEKEQSKWKLLGLEIGNRFTSPLKHPEFIFYFTTIIFLVGIAGVILTFMIEYDLTKNDCNHKFSNIHVILSIATYSIALLTSSSVDLVLTSKSHFVKEQKKLKRSLVMIGMSAILFEFFLTALSLIFAEYIPWSYIIVGIALVFSWCIWWITNSINPNIIKKDENPYDIIGGPPPNSNTSLELPGDLSGIKS